MTQFRHHFLLLPGDTIPIQKAESGHVPQAAALNTPPAKNVPFRKVNLSQGATFDALGAGKDGKQDAALSQERSYPCCLEFYDLP